MSSKKRWRDLSASQRTAIVVAGAAEVVLTVGALRDLAQRPAGQVRGSKWIWALVCLIQPVGPPAYLRFGRRR